MPRVVNVIKVRYVSATLFSLGETVRMCERERESYLPTRTLAACSGVCSWGGDRV